MATRQYIGARYVPEFFSGEGGSTEWVSGLTYEALTIVTRLGRSFTSRKNVPSNIGAPEDNSEYWVLTGNYNAQIQQYIEEVDTLSGTVSENTSDIETLEGETESLDIRVSDLEATSTGTGNCLWIGDSYVQANSLGVNIDKRFATLVSDWLGLTEYNYAIGGSGFLAPAGDKYDVQLSNAITAMSDNEKYRTKYVFVCGGRNDAYLVPEWTLSQLNTAVSSLYEDIWDNYPNATIVGIPMLWAAEAINGTYFRYLCELVNCMQNIGGGKAKTIASAYTWLLGNYGNILEDGVHPNVLGHYKDAIMITQSLLGGSAYVHPKRYEASNNGLTTKVRVINDRVYVTVNGTPSNALTFGGDIYNSQLGKNFGVITQGNWFMTLVGRDGNAAEAQVNFSHANDNITLRIQVVSDGLSAQEWHGQIEIPNGIIY